ncbi:MAG: sel1 repeat family protein, partial [Thermoguttaceae bacterium]|nr:sel1 repeat family protein [Thermoguttaceae bacterium]
GVEKNLEEARKWFQVASIYGNYVATNNLAFCFAAGWGVEKDAEKALELARGAAGSREPISSFFYMRNPNVRGVERYCDEALAWLKDAASQGDERAREALALFE